MEQIAQNREGIAPVMGRWALLIWGAVPSATVATFLDTVSIGNEFLAKRKADPHAKWTNFSTVIVGNVDEFVPWARDRRIAEVRSFDEDLHYEGVFVAAPAFPPGGVDWRSQTAAIAEWLAKQHAAGAVLAGAGAASFLFAQAGLLEGGGAALSRAAAPAFEEAFPHIRVELQAAVGRFGRVLTAGPVTTVFPLAIQFVGHVASPNVAHFITDRVELDKPREMGDLELFHEGGDDALIAQACRWFREHFSEGVDATTCAATLGVHPKTLFRRFVTEIGRSPADYLQTLRIDAAQRLLRRTTSPTDQVAQNVGYSNVHHFRQIFRRATGVSPAQFRKQGR